MATRLPLFPLGSVLVPGLVLPMHVFEPRYRILIQALMELPDSAPRHFGVVATRHGRESGADSLDVLHGVGCTAELREVTPYADGRFDIVTVGHERFRLHALDPTAGTPYHTGIVDLLDEPDGDGDLTALAGRVAARFTEYRERLDVEQASMPSDARVLSYLVAAAAVLDLPERQALLELPTTSERLREELRLLRREIDLVDAFGALPAVDLVKGPVSDN